jgi:hypothetical protein
MITIAIFGSIGYAIAYIVISILHFYSQMVSKGSYLSYTLPVSTNKLLMSKVIAVFFWGIFTAAMLFALWYFALDRLLLGSVGTSLKDLFNGIDGLSEGFGFNLISFTVVGTVATYVYTVPMLAFCMSLINTPALKNRNFGVAAAVIGYLVMSQVIGFIQLGIWGLYFLITDRGLIDAIFSDDLSRFGEIYTTLQNVLAVTSVVFAVVFYGLALRIYKKHRSV